MKKEMKLWAIKLKNGELYSPVGVPSLVLKKKNAQSASKGLNEFYNLESQAVCVKVTIEEYKS